VTWPARVTRNGQQLSGRVSALLDEAAAAARVTPVNLVVTQGSWSDGSKSAGTHAGGGAFDLRTWNLTQVQREALQWELRRRGVAAWLRGYGDGTTFDPHLHGIVCDEPGLSDAARQQCVDYSRGLDGLARKGPDPYRRPVVIGFPIQEDEDVPLTPEEIEKVAIRSAEHVWNRFKVSAADGSLRSLRDVLEAAYRHATAPTAVDQVDEEALATHLAAALIPALPGITQDALEAAVREAGPDVLRAVLGSLDNPPV
jgi:hypothetical protein